jgi:hypothetical protein
LEALRKVGFECDEDIWYSIFRWFKWIILIMILE